MPDQIQFLSGLLDSEMDRFWTRFNIFAAVQIGAFIGLLSNAKLLKQNKQATRAALVLILVFSVVGVIVTYRGFDLQHSMVKSLKELESQAPADARVAEYVLKNTRMPVHTNTYVCIGFACFCIGFWGFVFCWLECRDGYAKITIPKDEKT